MSEDNGRGPAHAQPDVRHMGRPHMTPDEKFERVDKILGRVEFVAALAALALMLTLLAVAS